MQTIPVKTMLAALENRKVGTLREAFPGEEPDITPEHDKECTGVTMWRDGEGFSVTFDPPMMLVAGCGYVFEETP